MICANTAEPIELSFEMWTLLDWAQIPHAKGQLLGERTCPGVPDDILTHRFNVWFVDSGGQKGAQIQSIAYIPGGANVPSLEGTLRNLENTIEQSFCGGDAALCQFTLTTCYYGRPMQ